MRCTWNEKDERCDKEAKFPQIATDGEVWANLCEEHNAQLEQAIELLDARKLLSSWVKAGGGPKKMASRM
jgi:hypothetical protein